MKLPDVLVILVSSAPFRKHHSKKLNMAVVITYGINESGFARVLPDENGQARIHMEGICSVEGRIDLRSHDTLHFLAFGPGIKQPSLDLPVKPSLIINQISDVDSHKTAAERCLTLCEAIPDVPVINHPLAVLNNGREKVSMLLKDIPGVIMPKTVRCAPKSPQQVWDIIEAENMKLPVIQRDTGQHNGVTMIRIDGPADLEKLHVYCFDGREFYLTEFFDYADKDGIYHTQRIVFVGGEPLLRQIFYDDQWKVNSRSKEFMLSRPDLGDPLERANRIKSERLPKAEAALKEVAARIGLDFFGMDCHINEDGEILVFEANATMMILWNEASAIFNSLMVPIEQKLNALIRKRLGE